jgi:hypothetical protein
MGKPKASPRYNVLSCRTNDAEWEEISTAIGRGNRSDFLRQAVLEKIRRDKQRRIDHALSR